MVETGKELEKKVQEEELQLLSDILELTRTM